MNDSMDILMDIVLDIVIDSQQFFSYFNLLCKFFYKIREKKNLEISKITRINDHKSMNANQYLSSSKFIISPTSFSSSIFESLFCCLLPLPVSFAFLSLSFFFSDNFYTTNSKSRGCKSSHFNLNFW